MFNFFRKYPLSKIRVQSCSSNSLSKKKWYINVREPFLRTLSIHYYLYVKMIHVILSFKLRPFSQPCFSLKSCFRCYSSLCLNQGNSCFFPFCVLLAWQKQFKSFLYLSTSFSLSLFLFSVGGKRRKSPLCCAISLSFEALPNVFYFKADSRLHLCHKITMYKAFSNPQNSLIFKVCLCY